MSCGVEFDLLVQRWTVDWKSPSSRLDESGAPPFSPSVALTPPSPGAIAIGVPQQRRVSWVSPAPSSRSGSCKKRRAALKSIPRQRSFSLESDSEFLRPGGEWQSERRSVSLKSSPLMSPRPQGASPPARSPAPRVPPPPVKQIPERSIFAELRRSSEIFKSILLNLSMKETDSGAATDQAAARDSAAAPAENQVDLAGLLAAHEKRRLNQQEEESSSSDSSSSCPSSCSASSLSSPDDDEDEGGAGSPRQDDPGGSLLRLNPNLPPDKVVGMAEVYTRQYLFTLPALFLAVVRGNATLVYLLLKYGAAVNFQDGHGNTALHLAVCQATVPWECVLDLVERGAQISLKNRAGVRAADLAPSCLLARLQDQMLSDCWSGLGAGSSSASTMLAQNAASSVGTDPYGASAPPSAASTGARSSNPARILRKLRTSSGPTALRTESTEEASSASVEMLALSSTGSVRSRASKCSLETGAAATSNNNNNNNKETSDMLSKQESRRRAKRKAWKDSRQAQASVQTTEKNPSLEAERSFQILHHMADNPECLGYLLRGLLAHISSLLLLLQKLNETSLHRSMAALLHNVLKTAIETYGIPQQPMESEEDTKSRRKELSAALCLLLKVCLSLIHGVHDLQYTAMVTINKVIDACVVHRLTHVKVKASEALQHPCNESSGQASDAARSGAGGQQQQQQVTVSSASTEPAPPARPSGSRTQRLGAKRLGSVWRHAAGEHLEQVRKALTEDFDKEESVIDVLSSVHALSVVNILHNSLTLYKRVVGSKQQCSPSQRWRHCSYHCLQILAARALLFMVEGPAVQTQLAQDQQLRILAAALDSTHDPQLLVLVLQIVATLALEPQHHRALIDQGLPDVLSQLLLPSDEWYYTNHSTKYARFVKHHAARTLVYLGLQHRVNLRFSVYDILQDEAPPPTPLLESMEDTYITLTSAPPSMVVCHDTNRILGLSVEGAVMHVLKALEMSISQGTTSTELSTLHWVLSGSSYTHVYVRGQVPARRQLSDPYSPLFTQSFLSCFPCVLSPVVLLRLLLHRLLTTSAHLQRWKSCASRSSFASASAHEAPRSPRSRASSTDTEPSSLRKRRKVNLTVDCSGNDAGVAVDELPPAPSRARSLHRASHQVDRASSLVPRDSVSSMTGLGLEPAVQATLFAFSHLLRGAPSRESLQSAPSSDGRNTPVPGSPSGVINLPVISLQTHKPRASFRFSSLRHSNKRRSKSQANIAKACITPVSHNEHRDTPEQEILAFQKQLQNLPDFDSPEHPSGGPGFSDPAAAAAEFLANRPYLRPRSRSMPRVTYESSRYLTLPELPWPSSGGSGRLHRGRSAGALGLQPAEHHGALVASSPATTPLDEKAPPAMGPPPPGATPCAPNSRRSSLSPSDRTGRRRDSPACIVVEVPPWHRAILNFIEEWLRMSRVELDRNAPLCRELRDFLTKVSSCGAPYQQWCTELRQEFPALSRDPDLESGDDQEETNREYFQYIVTRGLFKRGGRLKGNTTPFQEI
ncbi:uncharacterized protein [Periplaneta americana]|uniref:uncharacterized protein n=1 Tax=Periplaneta americana TaxID=6978 RepID=UPI0037E995A4